MPFLEGNRSQRHSLPCEGHLLPHSSFHKRKDYPILHKKSLGCWNRNEGNNTHSLMTTLTALPAVHPCGLGSSAQLRKVNPLHPTTHNHHTLVVTPIVSPAQALQWIPSPPPQQYLAVFGLLVPLSFQRTSVDGWQKLSLVSLAGGRGFLAGENHGAGHLAQSEFTLGSPQLEMSSQRPNKTLGKQQVSTC